MEIYLLKSLACLAAFLLFYKLLLENENMHVFKRFYLLFSVVAAIVIPLITFTTYVEPSSEVLNSVIYTSESPAEVFTPNNYLPYFLISVYFMGVLFFSIKFFGNLRNLILKIQKNPKVKLNSITNVLLSEKTQPHTFFSFIFFNKDKYLHNQIPEDVKIHEEAHARQKHSYDVLFIELLQIIFWINPLIFLLKKAIKLNHEFLADSAVINRGISTAKYQQTLLSFSSGHLQSELVNPINYSSIKKRFTVMKTKTSQMTIWARSLLLLPLLAVLLYGFSTREIIEKQDKENLPSVLQEVVLELVVDNNGSIFLDNKKVSIAEFQKIRKEKYTMASINAAAEAPQTVIDELIEVIRSKGISKISICSPGTRDFLNPHPVPTAQEKATPEMIAEYNKLVKHYNSLPQKNMIVRQEDINKIMAILSRMTPEQKSKAEKINFNVPPPPPPAPAPVPQTEEILPLPPPPAPPIPSVDKPVDLPPPAPASFKELVEKGAIFYYNFKKIKPEEARQLVEVEKKVNVNITKTDSGEVVVRLYDKEKKN